MDKPEALFTLGKVSVSAKDELSPSSFVFAMSAVAAARRGGKNSDYIPECAQFVVDVTGWHPDSGKPPPQDYDWTAAGAVDMANEMMSYDHE